MIPVWRWWVALLLAPVAGAVSVSLDVWVSAVVWFVYGVLFSVLMARYRRRLVEVPRDDR